MRQQQLVGAGVVVGEQRLVLVALDDVRREQRLVAGAVQVDRVARDAAAADREREAAEVRLQLAQHRRGDAPAGLAVGVRREHDDLVAVAVARGGGDRARGRSSAPRARRARAGARASRRRPACARARARRSRCRRGRARCRAPCRARRDRRGRRSRARSTACRNSAAAASEARSGPRTRSTSEATSVVTKRSSDGSGEPFAPTQAQLADDRVGDAQLDALDAFRLAQQRALLGGRARGDREHDARAVDQDEARVERARGGAHDLRQAGAGGDRFRDRLERPQVRRRRRLVARVRGHRPIVRGIRLKPADAGVNVRRAAASSR